jgi:hypothetical protein
VFEFAPDAWAEFLHAALGSAAAVEMRAAKHREGQYQEKRHRKREPKEGLLRNSPAHSDEMSQKSRGQTDETTYQTWLPPASAPKPVATLTLTSTPTAIAAPAHYQAATQHTPPRALISATPEPESELEPKAPFTPTACSHTAAQPPKTNALLALPSPNQTQTQPPQYDLITYEEGIDPDFSDEDCGDIKFSSKSNISEKF